jgi:putative glutamine amidotransferase
MKKIIGIPGWKIDGGFGVSENHISFISRFGNPVILMPWEEFHSDLDLLYLPGGMDVNPSSYQEIPGFNTSNTDVFKQFFLDHRLANYVEQGVAIFGVCLGFQQLNVFFGGKLFQHSLVHPRSEKRFMEGHKVSVVEDIEYKGEKTFGVNSHHHQLIYESMLANELTMTTYCREGKNKIVESFRHNSLPIVGIQWHPEEWFDRFSISEFQRLLNK